MCVNDETDNPAAPEEIKEAHRRAERSSRQRAGDDGGRDGRGRVDRDEKGIPCEDPLLEALIKEHPERDPAKIK